MQNEFSNRIKNIEDELLNLKTSSEYSSVRSASFTTTTNVYTGLYRIQYEPIDTHIFSIIYTGTSGDEYGMPYTRTPSANSQVVEVSTTYFDNGSWVTFNTPLTILSNAKVVSVTRI